MPRASKRFSFDGPWKGIDQVTADERLAPGWLREGFNLENYKGQLRPRRGFRVFPRGDTNPPRQDKIISGFAIPADRNVPYDSDDTIIVQSYDLTSEGKHETRFWRYHPETKVNWQEIGDAFSFLDPTDSDGVPQPPRKAMYSYFGGWTIISLGNSRPYAYARMEAADPTAANSRGKTRAATNNTVQIKNAGISGSTGLYYAAVNRPHYIVLTGLTHPNSVRQQRRIVGYNDQTRTVTVDRDWDVNPDADTPYTIYADYFRVAGIDAPVVAPRVTAVDGATVGEVNSLPDTATYDYVYTYYDTITQLESAPSPTSDTVTTIAAGDPGGPAKTIKVHWQPIGTWYDTDLSAARPFVNRVRIYRRQLSPTDEPNWSLVAEVALNNDPTGTIAVDPRTYFDDIPDLPFTNPPTKHGVPPSLVNYTAVHADRMFYVATDSRTIWYSEPSDGTTGIRGSEYVGPISFFIIPGGSPLTGLWSFGNQLLAFQPEGVSEIDVTPLEIPDDPFIRKIPGAAGCDSFFTIAEATASSTPGRRLYWCNDYGAYEFNGASTRNLTALVIPDIWAEITRTAWESHTQPGWYAAAGVYDPHYNRYMIFTQAVTQGGSVFLSYSLDTDSWLRGQISGGGLTTRANAPFCAFIARIRTPVDSSSTSPGIPGSRVEYPQPRLIIGLYDGRVGYWSLPSEPILEDNMGDPEAKSEIIKWSLLTPRFHLGDPVVTKKIYEIIPIFSSRSNPASEFFLNAYIDAQTSARVTRIFSPNLAWAANLLTDLSAPFYIGAWCRQISFRISSLHRPSPTTPPDLELTGFVINWRPKGLQER